MLSCFSHVGLLVTPMDYSPPGSFGHGILQARILELPFPSPGDLPDSGIKPAFPELESRFFTTEPPGKPLSKCTHHQKTSNKTPYSLFSFMTSKLLKFSVTQFLQLYNRNNMVFIHQIKFVSAYETMITQLIM